VTDTAIRVFITDDHPMVRLGLAAMIAAERDLQAVGEAANGQEAVQMLQSMPPARVPHVVLMDLMMPVMDGIAAITQLRPRLPDTRFLILTSLVEPREIRRAIDAGACGYLLKNASSQELVNVIRSAHAGRRVMAPEATDAMIAAAQSRAPGADLTPRELELLTLMTRGLGNQQIATQLSIALPTVKFHITNILGKLQVENRTEAVLLALKHKLVVQD
jgi:NarL family two-component system response regulator LiaR